MIKGIVCEDDYDFSNKIRENILVSFAEKNIDIEIDIANNTKDFIERIEKTRYDIFFFDIEIGEDDGIELAHYVRSENKKAIFIFITNKNERVYEVFSLDTFDFVRKDHFELDFPKIMERLIFSIEGYMSKYLIKSREKEYLLSLNEIIYIERISGTIILHTADEEIKSKYRYFTELEFSLEDNRNFGEIYRGIYVNYKYIKSIGAESIILLDNKELPLSRRKRKVIKEEYKNYILEK